MITPRNQSTDRNASHAEHPRRLIDIGTITWPQRLILALAYLALLAAAIAVATRGAHPVQDAAKISGGYLLVLGWLLVLTGACRVHWLLHWAATCLMGLTAIFPYPMFPTLDFGYWRRFVGDNLSAITFILLVSRLAINVVVGYSRHPLAHSLISSACVVGAVFVVFWSGTTIQPGYVADIGSALSNLRVLILPVILIYLASHWADMLDRLGRRLAAAVHGMRSQTFSMVTVLNGATSIVVAVGIPFYLVPIGMHRAIAASAWSLLAIAPAAAVAWLCVKWLTERRIAPASRVPFWPILGGAIAFHVIVMAVILGPLLFGTGYKDGYIEEPWPVSFQMPARWDVRVVPANQHAPYPFIVMYEGYDVREFRFVIEAEPATPASQVTADWIKSTTLAPGEARVQWQRDIGGTRWTLVGYARNAKELDDRMAIFQRIRDSFVPGRQPPWEVYKTEGALAAFGLASALAAFATITFASKTGRLTAGLAAAAIFGVFFGLWALLTLLPSFLYLVMGVKPWTLMAGVSLGGILQSTTAFLLACATLTLIGRSRRRSRGNIDHRALHRALLIVNLSLLLLIAIDFGFDRIGTFGDAQPLLLAGFLIVSFTWEIAMSGETLTNQRFHRIPREARLLLYLGYLVLVSACVVALPTSAPEIDTSKGMTFLAFPLVLSAFAFRLIRLTRSNSGV